MVLDSRPGDPVGHGEYHVLSAADATWEVKGSGWHTGVTLILRSPALGADIFASFGTGVDNRPLTVGTYSPVFRLPVSAPAQLPSPASMQLGFYSDHHCNSLTGRFIVREIEFGGEEFATVLRLAIDAEQHCDDAEAALFLAVRYNSTIVDARPFEGAYPTYSLSVVRPLHGTVSGDGFACSAAGSDCQRSSPAPFNQSLTATPDAGWIFTGWTQSCTGRGATTDINVNTVKICEATFADATSGAPISVITWQAGPSGEDPLDVSGRHVFSPANSVWLVKECGAESFLCGNRAGNGLWVTIKTFNRLGPEQWEFFFAAPIGERMREATYLDAKERSVVHTNRVTYVINGDRPALNASLALGSRAFAFHELSWDAMAFYAEFHIQEVPWRAAWRGTLQYQSKTGLPSMTLDKTALVFAAATDEARFSSVTAAQTVELTQSGPGTVTWTATSDRPWLFVTPTSGTGSATLAISTRFVAGLDRVETGTITLNFQGARHETATVVSTLNAVADKSTVAPFGNVETPVDGSSGIFGSIAVTGWALDDIQATRVRILREPVAGERAGAPVYLGDAVFVEGARPDIARVYPNYPRNTRAGWGYLLLTNALPNSGDGTFTLYAEALDAEGHTTVLGSTTIVCSNTAAAAPFGAIDTPALGETVSGVVHNFGWALIKSTTARADSPGGATVHVMVDGLIAGSPGLWTSRSDISAMFGNGYNFTESALAVYPLDTTVLTDGVHTLAWVVTATNGKTAGMGSRYFTVRNGRSPFSTAPLLETSVVEGRSSIQGRRGFDLTAPVETFTARDGTIIVQAEELDRIELRVGPHRGSLVTKNGFAPLPIGSHLDPRAGVFTWLPGVGFRGSFEFRFGALSVRIVLNPQTRGRVGPQIVIDQPLRLSVVEQEDLTIDGWAADLEAEQGTGIATVHVWAYPIDGAGIRQIPIFGVADDATPRPDVAARHGERFRLSGYRLRIPGLSPGTYDLAVFAFSISKGDFLPARTVRITIR